jgi:hypothetical protein
MSSESIIRLRISLNDTDPAIWRLVEVPTEMTLKDLHVVIQAAMGWDNAHLYEFQVGRDRIAGPGMSDSGFGGARPLGADQVRLADLAGRGVKRFVYIYDMGDNWEHEIEIERSLPAEAATAYPRLVDAAGRCPPEDVGGVPGFYAFLEAIGDPNHPEHNDLRDWYGDTFDPNDVGVDRIRKQLGRIAARRSRAAARRRR